VNVHTRLHGAVLTDSGVGHSLIAHRHSQGGVERSEALPAALEWLVSASPQREMSRCRLPSSQLHFRVPRQLGASRQQSERSAPEGARG
jgi:hypothetical protein